MNFPRRTPLVAVSRKNGFPVLSELAYGRRNAFFVPPDQTDEELKIYLSVCDMLPTNFECFPSMQMVPNPDLDSDESEIEVGRLIPFSGGSVEFPLGKGYKLSVCRL